MADEETIRRLEARLTRLEAALAQQPAGAAGVTPPGGTISDPAPWPGGGWGGWGRWPHPIVDPAPWWTGGGWWYPRWPTPVVDPAPWPTPIVDPAVFAPGSIQSRAALSATALGRIGPIGDPPPIDVSRFSISQLEASLHSINAEKARLASMETMITQQLEKLKKQGSQG
jgi:hypothetical protein